MNNKLIYENGVISNPDVLQIPTSIFEMIDLAKDSLIITNDKLEKVISFYLSENYIEIKRQIESNKHWSIVTLPIISRNPLLTDNKNNVLNIATIFFLIRANNFAKISSGILKREIKFRIASEVIALSYVYNLNKVEIDLAIESFKEVITMLNLNNIEIYHFDLNPNINKKKVIDRSIFHKTFLPNQFSPDIPIQLSLYLSNIIDEKQFARYEITKSIYDEDITELETKATTQSEAWANIRLKVDWDQPPFDNTLQFSIRPRSKRINFIPVCTNKNGQTMAPSVCCVGIRKDNTIFTAPKSALLLNPSRWIELVSCYGSMLIEKQ